MIKDTQFVSFAFEQCVAYADEASLYDQRRVLYAGSSLDGSGTGAYDGVRF